MATTEAKLTQTPRDPMLRRLSGVIGCIVPPIVIYGNMSWNTRQDAQGTAGEAVREPPGPKVPVTAGSARNAIIGHARLDTPA
jgi:hypothetical protein